MPTASAYSERNSLVTFIRPLCSNSASTAFLPANASALNSTRDQIGKAGIMMLHYCSETALNSVRLVLGAEIDHWARFKETVRR